MADLCTAFYLDGDAGLRAIRSVLPEINTHLKVNSFVRVYLKAKNDRDEGAPDQFAIGPSIQFYLIRMLRLKNTTAFDLDDAKSRVFVLETGYRNITMPDAPPANRIEMVLTLHFPAEDLDSRFGQKPGVPRLEERIIYLALPE